MLFVNLFYEEHFGPRPQLLRSVASRAWVVAPTSSSPAGRTQLNTHNNIQFNVHVGTSWSQGGRSADSS
jgi:hypothetical protein